MGDSSIEKMVHEYLDSMVGDNPVLTKEITIDSSWSGRSPVKNFYVNGIRIGSMIIRSGLLIEVGIRDSIMKLFNLDMEDSYLYFINWFNKLERDDR